MTNPFTEYPPERMEVEKHQTLACRASLALDLHQGNRMIGPHVVLVGLMVKTGCLHSLEGNTSVSLVFDFAQSKSMSHILTQLSSNFSFSDFTWV